MILETDYGSLVIATEDPAHMAPVLSAWDEHFAHADLPRTLSRHLRDAGFAIRERLAIPMFNPEFEDNPYGKDRLAMMASFAVGRKEVSKSEADAWLSQLAALGEHAGSFSVLIATCLSPGRLRASLSALDVSVAGFLLAHQFGDT